MGRLNARGASHAMSLVRCEPMRDKKNRRDVRGLMHVLETQCDVGLVRVEDPCVWRAHAV
jgi:hypothetical protein